MSSFEASGPRSPTKQLSLLCLRSHAASGFDMQMPFGGLEGPASSVKILIRVCVVMTKRLLLLFLPDTCRHALCFSRGFAALSGN